MEWIPLYLTNKKKDVKKHTILESNPEYAKVFALIFSPTCPKAKFRKNFYSNKFFHNFHLFESSFTCPRLWASGLERRLVQIVYCDCEVKDEYFFY